MSQISDDILDAALEEAFDKVPELNDCIEDERDDYEDYGESDIFNYMGMKAKVSSAEWRYDTLQLHTDSLEEIYNINKNYSRITSYE